MAIQGTIYPYFFIVTLLLVLIPSTIRLSKCPHPDPPSAVDPYTTCEPCRGKARKFKTRRRDYFTSIPFILKCSVVFVGWIAAGSLTTTMYKTRTTVRVWDPYKILGVSPFSSTEYVKKQYKRLSKKFHPDKQRGVPKEEAEAKFVDLTKAYKVYQPPNSNPAAQFSPRKIG